MSRKRTVSATQSPNKRQRHGDNLSSPAVPPVAEQQGSLSLSDHSKALYTHLLREKVDDVKVVLVDIEGTTTPISFVKEVLFPYARREVRQHLVDTWNDKQTVEDVKLLADQLREEQHVAVDEKTTDCIDQLVSFVHSQMDKNSKATPLKQLQGHIWRSGYASGALKGVMFPDVRPCFESWTNRGYKVYIYSSGSVEAQKLIFGYSDHGDMLPLISGHFDTKIGSKLESKSYSSICELVGVSPWEVVFLTDNIKEAHAAAQVGLGVLLASRPGNGALPDKPQFRVITSLCDAML